MRIKMNSFSEATLWLVCLLKVFHDAGNDHLENWFSDYPLTQDTFYEFVIEALGSAAPTVKNSENLYRKHGYYQYDDEVNIWAYSSKEMRKYYKLAIRLNSLEGNKGKGNIYITEIAQKIDDIRGFDSYCFDYAIGNMKKGAQLELLWGYEFTEEIAMCLWIVRVMEMFKKELPVLQEKYRKARRKKRLQKSMMNGGVACAA